MKKLLLAFAHVPDILAFVGGTARKYANAGWQIEVICATREPQGDYKRAFALLGISAVTFLDFEAGSLSKEHPGELEEQYYKAILAFVPDVVITHDPTGLTNHPDHIKLCRSATFAFQKYAKESARLYYVCLPQSTAAYLKDQKMLPGELYDKPVGGTQDKLITTNIDTKRFIKVKKEAASTYGIFDNEEEMAVFFMQPLVGQEHYLLRMQGVKEVFMGKNDRISNRL